MGITKRFTVCLALAAGMVALSAGPATLQAQVATSDAEFFVGDWELPLTTDMGPFEVAIDVADADGQLAATVGSMEGDTPVEDITMEGEDLVFSFTMDAQGQMMPVMMTLTPAGEELTVAVNVADGMFVANGTATRSDG